MTSRLQALLGGWPDPDDRVLQSLINVQPHATLIHRNMLVEPGSAHVETVRMRGAVLSFLEGQLFKGKS